MGRERTPKFTRRLVAAAGAATLLIVTAAYMQRDVISGVLAAQQAETGLLQPRAAQPVRVSSVVYSRPTTAARFTGTVRPRYETNLSFRVTGKLVERLVSVGDRVRTGQPIARLDDEDARLVLESAEAELLAAQAELQRAEAEASRSQRLLSAGHVAQAAHDRATATAAEARGRADRTLRARDLAVNRLDYMVLTASSDGVVTRELAESGQVVEPGEPIVSVARTDELDVVFALPEQRREILDQAVATARLWDRDAADYALRLRDVSPDADPATRTYRVRMGIVSPDDNVALGRTVTITLTTPAETPTAAIPLAAVLNDGQGAAVWRLKPDGQGVERVPVEIDALDGKLAMVRGGIAEGDLIVSLGVHKIDPARAVTVVESATASLN